MPIGLGGAGSAIAAAVAQQQPARMLGDRRLPIAADYPPGSLVVFDAIVKPEVTPLLALAGAALRLPHRARARDDARADRKDGGFLPREESSAGRHGSA